MTDVPNSKRPAEHVFLGILALAAIALHFFLFWALYTQLVTSGISVGSFGIGRLFWANLLIFVAVIGALAMLVYAAVRSFRAQAGAGYLLTLILMGVGLLLPWAGIALSFLVAGDAA